MSLLVSQHSEDNGDSAGTKGHGTVLYGRNRYSRDLLTLHLLVEENDDRMEKFSAVVGCIVGKPLVKVQVLPSRSEGGNIESEGEGADLKKRVQYL